MIGEKANRISIDGKWCPMETIKIDGKSQPIQFYNTAFDEKEGSLIRFSVGGNPLDLVIDTSSEGKTQFTISCTYGESKDEFTGNNINECFAWVREWFSSQKR